MSTGNAYSSAEAIAEAAEEKQRVTEKFKEDGRIHRFIKAAIDQALKMVSERGPQD